MCKKFWLISLKGKRPRRILQDNIKMDLRVIGFGARG
jgi:hypothetical protein